MNNNEEWYHHRPAGSQHTAGGFVTDSPDRHSTRSTMVCHVHGSTEYGRLIAAAPDLLAALEAFRAVGGTDFDGWATAYNDAIALARAAIKKASGG